MLMIVIVHTNYLSIGVPNQIDIAISPISSFWRILAEQICIVGVNIFVLISGWFGIKPSFKGFCSLLFQVFFWGIIITLIGLACHLEIPVKSTLKVFCFGGYYWFVIAYIGLYVVSPLLNSYIDNTPPKQFLSLIVCFFIVEFVFGWIISSESFSCGYSIISFIGLYLLARYIRLHSVKLKSTKPIFDILMYCLMTIIPATVSFIGIKHGWTQLHPLYYSSPFVVAASVFLFLFVSKFKFESKVIDWIGCSTFSVYIIHLHPLIAPYFKSLMQHIWVNYSTFNYSCIVLMLAIVFLLTCALLDKIRIHSWRLICSSFLDKTICKIEALYDKLLIGNSNRDRTYAE